MTQHNLTTSEGGRAYVAEFFSTRLRRHDFGRYIAERLAADFACALAEYLNEHLGHADQCMHRIVDASPLKSGHLCIDCGTVFTSTSHAPKHAVQVGRIEQAATEEMIRFCPECGCLGNIPSGYQACCPDSSEARMVPKRFAAMCAETFQLCISQPYPSKTESPSSVARATPPSRHTPEYAEAIEQLCASLGWHRNKAALLDSDGIFRARTDDAVAIRFANGSTSSAPTAEQAEGLQTQAARDVLAERQRQVSAEGWTPEHDDEHDEGEMASAAAAYAAHSCGWNDSAVRDLWPPQWHLRWLKTSTPRRDLVKAGALILAEIERIDRNAPGTCFFCSEPMNSAHESDCPQAPAASTGEQ
jgi:hypothetical protein